MKIAIATFDGFNEIDSIVPAHILNRVSQPGWKAEIAAPTKTITSMNGIIISAQQPLEFLTEADVVIFGSGRRTQQTISDASIMARIKLVPDKQLIASQCSGALMLAHLGLLENIPACTDLKTRPTLEAAGVNVLDAAFHAEGDLATSGGCLSAQYLATWIIWRLLGKEEAKEALSYVVPVGQQREYISRAIETVAPYISGEKQTKSIAS